MNKCNTLIEKYPHLYKDPDPEAPGGRYSMQLWGFETADGWFELLEFFSKRLSKHLKENPIEDFIVHQVKEKFGGLRIYPSRYDDIISRLIQDAETEAYKTCEVCGSQDQVDTAGKYWVRTLCKTHREEQKIKDEERSKK